MCGITVAPRMPIARYSFSPSVRMVGSGTKPATIAPASGREIRISNRKQPAIVAISAVTSASSNRNPLCWRYSTSSTSSAVITIP